MKVDVWVKLKSKSRNSVTEVDESKYIIYTNAPAKDGLANQSVVTLLSKHLGISKSKVQIVQGHKSRHKVIEISN